MKDYAIVGWAYCADVHCTACAAAAGMDSEGALDSEGNEPHPVFAGDESVDIQACGTCGEVLDG